MDNLNKKKRIGIDARFYGPIGKGLGRYTQEIVDNVIKIDIESEYVIFLRKENYDEFICDGKRVKKVLADVRWYSLAEQILMPYYLLKDNLDLVHFPHFNIPIFYPKKFIITIHDLILVKYPTARATTLGPALYKIKNLFYKLVIWLGVRRAKKIIGVSKYTSEDIIKHFKIKTDKVVSIYEGVANLAKGGDSLFAAKLDEKETLSVYNIISPFLLYVGNAYPHKNLEGLIDVFEELIKNNSDLRLVLVGKEDYFYKRIKDYAKQKKLWNENDLENSIVIFPGYVPDAKLEILFKRAATYVLSSFYAGFHLPTISAIGKGCPAESSGKT